MSDIDLARMILHARFRIDKPNADVYSATYGEWLEERYKEVVSKIPVNGQPFGDSDDITVWPAWERR